MNVLKDQLKADLTAAMKAREPIVVGTLRMALAAIMNAEVAGDVATELTDEQTLNVLNTEAKRRTEAAEIFANAGRAESAAQELAERAVIERYLPAALSDADLQAMVSDEVAAAAAAGVTGGKAMGAVVKAVRTRAGSTADGARIAELVKAALL